MKTKMGVREYFSFPLREQTALTRWLEHVIGEPLEDALVVSVTLLGEGQIAVERLATGPDGEPYLSDDFDYATSSVTYTTRTPPPVWT